MTAASPARPTAGRARRPRLRGGLVHGVAFHSTVLAGLGVDESEISAMRDGGAPSEPTQAAVHHLVRDIVIGRGKVSDTGLDRAAEAGLATEAILLECTFAGLVGMVDNLAGRVELDGFLAPRAWTDQA